VKWYRLVNPVPSVFMANTVPTPEVPPLSVVPYKMLPDKVKLADGRAPS